MRINCPYCNQELIIKDSLLYNTHHCINNHYFYNEMTSWEFSVYNFITPEFKNKYSLYIDFDENAGYIFKTDIKEYDNFRSLTSKIDNLENELLRFELEDFEINKPYNELYNKIENLLIFK